MRHWTLAGLALCLLPSAARAQDAAAGAKAWLSAALDDPKKADAVLAALRVSNDRDAAPIFGALTRSGDRRSRLAATAAIARLAPQESVPYLLERLQQDTLHAVRAEALAHLLEMKAISPEQLQAALLVDDDNVRCLAARGLLRQGRKDQAGPALRKLAQSKDLPTACMSRMSLLGMGEPSHLEPLSQALLDGATPDAVLTLMLQQVADEKIRPAGELAQAITQSARPITVRVMAYRAVSALSATPASTLAQAIGQTREITLQVHLVNLLSAAPDNQEALAGLAGGEGTAAALARLELARSRKDPPLDKAASAALALGHPVVIDYVLDRCAKDITALGEKADAYTPALLGFIRATNSDSREMGAVHVRTARAATLLCDLGTPAALAGVKELVNARHTTVAQAVAAGMRWSKNKAVCEIARPLLTNPYRNVAVDAALTLGMLGDVAAAGPLRELVARGDREQPSLMTLACWYLLKIEGQTAQTARELAKQIK